MERQSSRDEAKGRIYRMIDAEHFPSPRHVSRKQFLKLLLGCVASNSRVTIKAAAEVTRHLAQQGECHKTDHG
jgi:hypothetical protein